MVVCLLNWCWHDFVFRIGKNNITALGGKYLASAIQKSTSIFDVG